MYAPICMTTLTTIIAMIPNCLAFGKAGKMMQGLALVNVGGLVAATILTLVLLPSFYRVVITWERAKKMSMISWTATKEKQVKQ